MMILYVCVGGDFMLFLKEAKKKEAILVPEINTTVATGIVYRR